MHVFWTVNCFNYLDDLDNETKLIIRNKFNKLISYFPLRFPEINIGNKKVRYCVFPKLPFVILFQLNIPENTCTVLRVFHYRQEKKL